MGNYSSHGLIKRNFKLLFQSGQMLDEGDGWVRCGETKLVDLLVIFETKQSLRALLWPEV